MDTIIEFIESALESAPEGIGLHAAPQTILETNDNYAITFKWTTEDGATREDIPIYDHGTLPLTSDEAYSVTPTFTHERDYTYDQMFHTETADFSIATSKYPDVREKTVSKLKQRFNEVHLSEEQFINLIEGDGKIASLVDMVTVTNYCNAAPQVNELIKLIEDIDENTLPESGGFYFLIDFKSTDPQHTGGINPFDRFSHVSSVELNGHEYPAAFEVEGTTENRSNAGQPIYTSEFLVEKVGTADMNLEDMIEQINWAEYFHSDHPLPEQGALHPAL